MSDLKFHTMEPHPSQVEFFERMSRSTRMPKKRPSYKRPEDAPQCRKVIDTETGVIYDSIKDCAKEHCMYYQKMFALLRGLNRNGYSLRVLEATDGESSTS